MLACLTGKLTVDPWSHQIAQLKGVLFILWQLSHWHNRIQGLKGHFPSRPPVSLGLASFGLGFILVPGERPFSHSWEDVPNSPRPTSVSGGWGTLIRLGRAWVRCLPQWLVGWDPVYGNTSRNTELGKSSSLFLLVGERDTKQIKNKTHTQIQQHWNKTNVTLGGSQTFSPV